MKTIMDMALDAGFTERELIRAVDSITRFAELVFEQGRQEGMKQERALGALTKLGQEIEAQPQRPWVELTDDEVIAASSIATYMDELDA